MSTLWLVDLRLCNVASIRPVWLSSSTHYNGVRDSSETRSVLCSHWSLLATKVSDTSRNHVLITSSSCAYGVLASSAYGAGSGGGGEGVEGLSPTTTMAATIRGTDWEGIGAKGDLSRSAWGTDCCRRGWSTDSARLIRRLMPYHILYIRLL